ncbi:transcriptional regulator, Fur family [Prevotella sp. DNF00663]|uniref:Fur family transcriptional regulator n=1 Tax=Prevotella sp. DNF00663 TaxID=1384078 RepID=UPI0007858B1C|nr:Fur family transcriptional regulator [Prevotella sp. DNF00663]KXB82118.1 transcriptional regulator, Fur family [Prevotella sp. DNF00663]
MNKSAYHKLVERGIRPSAQRLAIMDYLLTHFTHPTVEDVYQGLHDEIPTLSRTTVYNTLHLLAERNAVQMITIDDRQACYDGNTAPHVHFFCKKCGKIVDLMDEDVPTFKLPKTVHGHVVDEVQLYYKGICSECANMK